MHSLMRGSRGGSLGVSIDIGSKLNLFSTLLTLLIYAYVSINTGGHNGSKC